MSTLINDQSVTLPGKFRNIFLLAEQHPVPAMKLITESHLARWLDNFPTVKATLRDIERNIAITSGAFLTQDMKKINAVLQELRWSEHAVSEIGEFIGELGYVDGELDLAIRSACLAEDLHEKSFAGVYESVLNVRSIEDVQSAVITVFNSFYSLRAVMEKRNIHNDNDNDTVNIIAQRMVAAEFSGVAFSCHPLTGQESLYIEYVSGLGEGLVSGQQEPAQLLSDSDHQVQRDAASQIANIVASARALLDSHVDIEWACEAGTVWLLQARPVTNITITAYDSTPVAQFWPLYGDLPAEVIDTLPAYALYFNQKRKPLTDIAYFHQKKQPGAIILRVNHAGLTDAQRQKQLLEHFHQQQVVVDFSDSVRQLIIDKSTLTSQLSELMTVRGQLYTMVIRDFIQGEYGLITREVTTPEGKTLVAELSADGLMAINRGSAVSQILTLGDNQQTNVLTEEDISLLKRVTTDALSALGEVQIEWVLAQGHLYALDYSNVSDTYLTLSSSGRVMSPGYARGPAYHISQTEQIESYSIAPSMSLTDVPDASVYGDLFSTLVQEMEKLPAPPIIFAHRPYAALASLIPWAAGFVFEKGSLLCHLGILLREKKLPAVCDETLFSATRHGDPCLLKASSVH
ncbi:PEP/pyruvate-binding domain-containing protein [Pantoea agglomerans]|uniref:PEP/pyruvate-binding domain-containing protein n=1 Tax=Enterobacter agglomerans TaxID=549 RepID=UPI000F042E19|nr:PEP/pyruvate-binding domain-containing protein [Pantoea agglomerans]AYP23493.1 hypothetical protein D0A61_11265 [Pantoea agglomerans]